MQDALNPPVERRQRSWDPPPAFSPYPPAWVPADTVAPGSPAFWTDNYYLGIAPAPHDRPGRRRTR